MTASATYTPGHTGLHRADARAKLLAGALLAAALFTAGSLAGVAIVATAVVAGVASSSLGAAGAYGVLRPVLPLVVLIVVAQLLVGSPTVVLYDGAVVESAPAQALLLVLRLCALLLLVAIVTFTTGAMGMAHALEWLFSPLRLLRVPVSDIALMFALSIGFVPMMASELERLQLAQLARGARVSGFAPSVRLRMRTALVVPLIVLAFRRAHELAQAMRIRGFARGVERSRYREQAFAVSDIVLVLATLVAAVVAVGAS